MGCGFIGKLGTIIIDELRICYSSGQELERSLSDVRIGDRIIVGDYLFSRVKCDTFRYKFNVCMLTSSDEEFKVAELKFGHFTETSLTGMFFYKIVNSVLYDSALFKKALQIPDEFGLQFHNFTALDLAIDFSKSLSKIVKRMIRDRNVTCIINGKAIINRSAVIKNLSFQYSTTSNRLLEPTITIKQAKAAKNKSFGTIVQMYDKKREIEDASEKDYILSYYGNPKRLYRLEVRLHYWQIAEYFKSKKMQQNISFLQDQDFLRQMLFYHLSSVIRFTKKRKKIDWMQAICLFRPIVGHRFR